MFVGAVAAVFMTIRKRLPTVRLRSASNYYFQLKLPFKSFSALACFCLRLSTAISHSFYYNHFFFFRFCLTGCCSTTLSRIFACFLPDCFGPFGPFGPTCTSLRSCSPSLHFPFIYVYLLFYFTCSNCH